jgi:hypothetical protein
VVADNQDMQTTADVPAKKFSRVALKLHELTVQKLRWRPGIAMQLGIAFVGVAVLAAVANFAVQRTISITTTRVSPAHAMSQTSDVLDPGIRATPVSPDPASFATATASLERLVHTVETGLLTPSPEQSRAAKEAAEKLRAEMARLYGTTGSSHVDAALAAGLDAMGVARLRRSDFEEYSTALTRVDARLQDSPSVACGAGRTLQ